MSTTQSAIELVRNLQPGGKHLLEGILGQRLEENDQVFIMVLSPHSEPDEAARMRARAGLEETFRKTESYAERHSISGDDIDAAIEEAVNQARRRSG